MRNLGEHLRKNYNPNCLEAASFVSPVKRCNDSMFYVYQVTAAESEYGHFVPNDIPSLRGPLDTISGSILKVVFHPPQLTGTLQFVERAPRIPSHVTRRR